MQVEYIPLFRQALDKLLSCSNEYYSQQQLSNIVTKIKIYRNLLIANPHLGNKEPLLSRISEKYRSLVITKRIKLIYYVTDDTIYFTDLWSIRQSPTSLVSRIESL